MKDQRGKVRSGHIFDGEAGVVEHGLVCIKRGALRIVDKNHLRYSIGYPAKLALILPQFLFRTFAVFNVGAAAIPVDDLACLVAKGNRADEKPSIVAIEAPQARFELTRFARSQECLKLVQ